MLAAGREAEVFAQPDGTILKLLHVAGDDGPVLREAAALGALRAAGVAAPEPLGTVAVDGRAGLLMERVEGTDLLSLLGRQPLRTLSGGRLMARVHVAMHDLPAPAALPDVREVLRDRIGRAAPLGARLRGRALALLGDLPAGDRLLHGDLHLGNLIGSWTAPVVIDWGGAAGGDPLADVGQTALLHRLGVPPGGAPALVRALAPLGRRLLRGRYLATYRRLRGLDHGVLARWELVQAAGRLSAGIDDEEPALLALLDEGLR